MTRAAAPIDRVLAARWWVTNGADEEEWVADADLEPAQRAVAAQIATPRVGLDGARVWPLDELPEPGDRDG